MRLSSKAATLLQVTPHDHLKWIIRQRAFGEPDCWQEVVYSQNDLKAIPFISYLAHQVVLDSSVGKGGGILKERCPTEYTQKLRSIYPTERSLKLLKQNQSKLPVFSRCADPASLNGLGARKCKQTCLSKCSSDGRTWSRRIVDWRHERANHSEAITRWLGQDNLINTGIQTQEAPKRSGEPTKSVTRAIMSTMVALLKLLQDAFFAALAARTVSVNGLQRARHAESKPVEETLWETDSTSTRVYRLESTKPLKISR